MSIRIVSHARRAPSINLSALIDVLFILIVFVIVTSSFDQVRAVDVAVPRADATATADARAARLTIEATGAMRLDEAPVTEATLPAALAAARTRRETLLLVADRDVPLERATRILALASRAGFGGVSIATRPP